MCTPLAVVALAATAAGTYAQYRGQKQANKAMNAAQAAESMRQKGLRGEADALFNESLGKQTADAQKDRLADKQAEREAAATSAQTEAPVATVPVQGGAPTVVADETAARVNQGNFEAKRAAMLAAQLEGYGDLNLTNALLNTRYGQGQANIANFMQGSANVLPLEMKAASHRGDKMKAIGSGLQAIGSLAGMGAGMGVDASWFAAPAAMSAIGPNGLPVNNGSKLGVGPGGHLVSTKPIGF